MNIYFYRFVLATMNATFSKGSGEEQSYPQLDLSGKLIIKVRYVLFSLPGVLPTFHISDCKATILVDVNI